VSVEVQQALKAMRPTLGHIKDVIIYDSDCAVPIFNDRKWFSEMKLLPQPFGSLAASGEVVESR
jgi:hypothetical protein